MEPLSSEYLLFGLAAMGAIGLIVLILWVADRLTRDRRQRF